MPLILVENVFHSAWNNGSPSFLLFVQPRSAAWPRGSEQPSLRFSGSQSAVMVYCV